MKTAAALAIAGMLCVPLPAAAQVIEGRVSDERGGALRDVAISVMGRPGVGAISDRFGRFILSDLPAGSLRIHFDRLGYAPLTATVDVHAGETTPLAVALTPDAIELDEVEVRVGGAVPFLEINGYLSRTRRGFGRQLSRTRLDELRMIHVSDAMQHVPGLRLSRDLYTGSRVVAFRPSERRLDGQGCALTVYIDGVRTLDANVNQVPPDWLIAMEVYLGAETPVQYRTSDNCGAVLLWTRRY